MPSAEVRPVGVRPAPPASDAPARQRATVLFWAVPGARLEVSASCAAGAGIPATRAGGRVKAPWVYARVVKACGALSVTQRLIWPEHRALANGRAGCTMSASQMGRRLAMARVTIERARQQFLSLDLVRKRDRGRGKTAEWRPELPSECRPLGERCTDDEIEACAERLAAHIKRANGTSLTGEGGQEPPTGSEEEPHSPS